MKRAEFRASLAIDPKSPGGYQGIGATRYEQGRYQEAIAAFKKVVALSPHNDGAYMGWGASLRKVSDYSAGFAKIQWPCC